MVDLLALNGIARDEVRDSLLRHFDVRDDGEQQTDRTFYDTFDGLVRDAGLAVVYEAGRLTLVEQDSGREKASIVAPKPSRPLLAAELEAGPLRDALAPIIDVRALLPVARVRGRERALRLLDEEQKTVVRLTLEKAAAVSSSDRVEDLQPRLHLAAVRGYDKELRHARHELEHELHYIAADRPLLDEAVSAIGGTPGGISSRIDVALSREQRADSAAALILCRLLDVIEANLEGTIADTDTEFLHDFRVSIRRSRSVQRQLRRVFPPGARALPRGVSLAATGDRRRPRPGRVRARVRRVPGDGARGDARRAGSAAGRPLQAAARRAAEDGERAALRAGGDALLRVGGVARAAGLAARGRPA